MSTSEQCTLVDMEGIEDDCGADSTQGTGQSLQCHSTFDSQRTSFSSSPSPMLQRKRKPLKVQFTVDQSEFESSDGLSTVESITRKVSVISDPDGEKVYEFLRRLTKRPTIRKYCIFVSSKRKQFFICSFL